MAYEIVHKKRRRGRQERVTISSNGRTLMLNESAAARLGTSQYIELYLDKGSFDGKLRVAICPAKKGASDAYKVTRPKNTNSVMLSAKALLSSIGYTHSDKYSAPAQWVQRVLEGKKTWVLEFAVEKKYCDQNTTEGSQVDNRV